MNCVYIIENLEGMLYVGQTSDLASRVISHNRADKIAETFTRKNGPWRLVWSEEHPTRSSAMAREKQIKKMKSARWIRENLLNTGTPTRRD